VPDAFELAESLMADTEKDPRVRLEAAKFLVSYGLGAPPKETTPDPIESVSDADLLAEIDRRTNDKRRDVGESASEH
jgi:hypothetical protein